MSKVVLVTGASSGIGKSIGELLQRKGYKVYGTSRNPKAYNNSNFSLLTLDVTKKNTIAECVQTIISNEGQLDILINNAGIGITGPIEEIPEAEIKHNFETNFFGPINCIKAVLPQMRKQQSGLIINITSIAAYIGLPYRGIYSASKSALEILTESLRMEVHNFNIKVTNIAPGDFATDIASRRFHAPVVKGSSYEKEYKQVLKTIDKDVNKGSNPNLISLLVLKIIQTKDPKINYKAGAIMQKFSIVLKWILPDKVFEKILLKHYKL